MPQGDVRSRIRSGVGAEISALFKLVSGHGPLTNKAQLVEYRAMLVASRDRMAKLIAEGKSEADIQVAKPFADFDAKWAANEQASRNWMRVVYASLKQ